MRKKQKIGVFSQLGGEIKQIGSFFGFGRSTYESANRSTVRSRVPGAAPQDNKRELTSYTRSELVAASRYLHKNSGFYIGMVNDIVTYSIGDGLTPLAGSNDEAWNERAEEYFEEWSTRCEITERFSFSECQALICRGIDVDGEIIVVKVRDGNRQAKLQILESHSICNDSENTDYIDGIKFNAYGAPVSYSVKQDDGSFKYIPAYAVLHVYDPLSISGVRSAPTMQHSIRHLLDEGELLALEMTAVKDNAGISRTIKNATGTIDEEDPMPGEVVSTERSDPLAIQKITGGKVIALKPDEDISVYESTRPSQTFTGFLTALKQDSAAGIIPFEFTHDSSQIGGAGVRLVVAKADRKFSQRQNVMIHRCLNSIWGYVIGDAIERGELESVEGWNRVEWNTPRRITVDAGRESQQDRADVAMGIKTLEDLAAERGNRFKKDLRRRGRNASAIVKTAKEFCVPVEMIYNPSIAQVVYDQNQKQNQAGDGDTEEDPPTKKERGVDKPV